MVFANTLYYPTSCILDVDQALEIRAIQWRFTELRIPRSSPAGAHQQVVTLVAVAWDNTNLCLATTATDVPVPFPLLSWNLMLAQVLLTCELLREPVGTEACRVGGSSNGRTWAVTGWCWGGNGTTSQEQKGKALPLPAFCVKEFSAQLSWRQGL